jgi:outer membrane protein assembly factor BamB
MGPFVMRDDKLFLLDDDGNLYLFRIEGSKATQLANHRIMEAIEAWAPMALAGKYLIVRDQRNMICLNIGRNN